MNRIPKYLRLGHWVIVGIFCTSSILLAAPLPLPYQTEFSEGVAEFTSNNSNWKHVSGSPSSYEVTLEATERQHTSVSISDFPGLPPEDFTIQTEFEVTRTTRDNDSWGLALFPDSATPSTYILADVDRSSTLRILSIRSGNNGAEVNDTKQNITVTMRTGVTYTLTVSGTYDPNGLLTLSLAITDGEAADFLITSGFSTELYSSGRMGLTARGGGGGNGTDASFYSFSVTEGYTDPPP